METLMTAKDWLEIIVVPVSLALVALLWPLIQSQSRKRAFMRLIQRELREIESYPELAEKNGWTQHLRKTFVHQCIFRDPSTNQDFLLSLDPDVTYYVSQLWEAHALKDFGQWHHYLKKLVPYDESGKLAKTLVKWELLEKQYVERRWRST
jgi:hypothetical protein